MRALLISLLALLSLVSGATAQPNNCLRGPTREDDAYQNWFVDNMCGGNVKIYYTITYRDKTTPTSGSYSPPSCSKHVRVVQTSESNTVSFSVELDQTANSTDCASPDSSGTSTSSLSGKLEAARRKAQDADQANAQSRGKLAAIQKDADESDQKRFGEFACRRDWGDACMKTCPGWADVWPRSSIVAACENQCSARLDLCLQTAAGNKEWISEAKEAADRADAEFNRQTQISDYNKRVERERRNRESEMRSQPDDSGPSYVAPSYGSVSRPNQAPSQSAPPRQTYLPPPAPIPPPPRPGGGGSINCGYSSCSTH